MNKDSVGLSIEDINEPAKSTNRARIATVRTRNKPKFRMKMAAPMPVSPGNRYGAAARRSAVPPVDKVQANHAHVK